MIRLQYTLHKSLFGHLFRSKALRPEQYRKRYVLPGVAQQTVTVVIRDFGPEALFQRLVAERRLAAGDLAAPLRERLAIPDVTPIPGTRTELASRAAIENSAVFATHAGLAHPVLFAAVIPLSGGWKPPESFGPQGAPRARFVFSAGIYEAGFYTATRRTAEALRNQAFDVVEEYPIAGHDPNAWAMMLAKYLPQVFGNEYR